jgi:hypothetical protein
MVLFRAHDALGGGVMAKARKGREAKQDEKAAHAVSMIDNGSHKSIKCH